MSGKCSQSGSEKTSKEEETKPEGQADDKQLKKDTPESE